MGLSVERTEERFRQAERSEFGRLTAEIDEAERIAGERLGGPTVGVVGEIARLERRLYRLRPTTISDWRWLSRRLARALENGWHGGEVTPLLKLAG